MNELSTELLTTKELAEKTGRTGKRVRQLALEMAKIGLAVKKQAGWWFDPRAVEFVKSQPKPGPKKKQGKGDTQ
jgi:DNA-binding IclR family transcriptional regulator